METDQRLRLPALTEYRAASNKRRCVAFCDAPEYVLRSEVRPLTPATFSMLYAMGSAFVAGGPVELTDVRDYVWFHSPHFVRIGAPGWKRKKRRALHRLDFELFQPWRKWIGLKMDRHRFLAVLSIATAEIKEMVDAAFADAPAKSGRPGKPLASLEAFFIHEFATSYGWPPEKTRHTPLRQLVQLHRCIRSGRGQEVTDQGEDEILFAHLQAKNAALAAQREAKVKAGRL